MTNENTEKKQRNIRIGKDVHGSLVVTGDNNTITITKIRSERMEPESAKPTPIGPNPYLGLGTFQESDADRFFGRASTPMQSMWREEEVMQQLSSQAVLGSHNIEAHTDVSAAQTLHIPTPMLREMEKYAARLNRNVSWCARMAWSIACADIGDDRAHQSAKGSRLLSGRKRPTVIELPLSTWLHLTLEAERLDRSRSWMVQRAWLMARSRFLDALR